MGNVTGSDLGGESKWSGRECISGVPDKSNCDYGKEELLPLKLFPCELSRWGILFIKTMSPCSDHQFFKPWPLPLERADLLIMHLGARLFLFELVILHPLHSPAHQACKHSHDHLGLYFHEVFWESIHPGSDSSSHWHSVPIVRGNKNQDEPLVSQGHDRRHVSYCKIIWLGGETFILKLRSGTILVFEVTLKWPWFFGSMT